MRLCFSTYSSLLLKCKVVTVTQKAFVDKLLSSLDPQSTIGIDEAAISCYVRGKRNISPSYSVFARDLDVQSLLESFRSSVLPLIDQNKYNNLVYAMKDLVKHDDGIKENTIVECVSKLTKTQVINNVEIPLDKFLAGLFLYVVLYTKNIGTSSFAKQISDEYVSSFDNLEDYCVKDPVLSTDQPISLSYDYFIDEDTYEKARIFCLDHEKELSLLPLCEMAGQLNPEHKHVRELYTDFIRQNKKTQKAILIHKGIKPFEFMEKDWMKRVIDQFEKEIETLQLSSHPFLYNGAKYFHRAFLSYSEIHLDDVDPYIFKIQYNQYLEGLFKDVRGNLSDLIFEYMDRKEHFHDDEEKPPFDIVWDSFNLSSCEEYKLCFWVCRFIIDVCHALHVCENNENDDGKWIYKDCIDSTHLVTMEDLYYYAAFLLYISYCTEG